MGKKQAYNRQLFQSRYYVRVTCPDCGRERSTYKHNLTRKDHQHFEFGLCRLCACKRAGAERQGKNNSQWQGGKHVNTNGYMLIKIYPDNPYYSMHMTKFRILEHRLIMAQYLGRCIRKSEIVHHLNGIKTDNRIENLCLVSKNDHPSWTFIEALQQRVRQLEIIVK